MNKPLCRWTTVTIEGMPSRTLFRYEKLADFCFFCGRLNHLDMDCLFIPPSGKKYYGPWLWANNQNPISLTDITLELDRLNSVAPDLPLSHSPRTPINQNKNLEVAAPEHFNYKGKDRIISLIPFGKLS